MRPRIYSYGLGWEPLEGDRLFFRSEEDGGDSGGGSGDDDSGESQEDESDEGSDESEEDEDDARVRKANREAARYRRELRDAQKRLKELEDRDKSEGDRAKSEAQAAKDRAEKLEQQIRETKLESQVVKLSAKMGFRDPDDVLAHLAREGVDYDDESNEPLEVEDMMKKLARAKPHLVKSNGDGSGGGDTGNAGRRDRADEQIDKLPPAARSRARLRRAFSTK